MSIFSRTWKFWVLFLSVGLTACGGSSSGGSGNDNRAVSSFTTERGVFIDSLVSNLRYQTETLTGYTNEAGEFFFNEGENITFSVGDIEFPSIPAKAVITPLDLFETENINHPAVVNVSRLLQSLDDDDNPDNGLQIDYRSHLVNSTEDIDLFAMNFDSTVEELYSDVEELPRFLLPAQDAIAHLSDTLSSLDQDADGIVAGEDNCDAVANPEQLDEDLDGIGDACDDFIGFSDTDKDSISNDVDNCLYTPNNDQADADLDGIGDACDGEPQGGDTDRDRTPDLVDNCPTLANSSQLDTDQDGIGDACDATPIGPDTDGDDITDSDDNCTDTPNTGQEDNDGDNEGNVCDATPNGPDTDGDDIPDAWDNCPNDASTNQLDRDDDGLGDICDAEPLGLAPVAYDQSELTYKNDVLNFDVTGSDDEGSRLRYSITAAPTNGALSGLPPYLSYRSNDTCDDNASEVVDSFTYSISDNLGNTSNTATVTINQTCDQNLADAPRITRIFSQISNRHVNYVDSLVDTSATTIVFLVAADIKDPQGFETIDVISVSNTNTPDEQGIILFGDTIEITEFCESYDVNTYSCGFYVPTFPDSITLSGWEIVAVDVDGNETRQAIDFLLPGGEAVGTETIVVSDRGAELGIPGTKGLDAISEFEATGEDGALEQNIVFGVNTESETFTITFTTTETRASNYELGFFSGAPNFELLGNTGYDFPSILANPLTPGESISFELPWSEVDLVEGATISDIAGLQIALMDEAIVWPGINYSRTWFNHTSWAEFVLLSE